jgi:hypothetical protein
MIVGYNPATMTSWCLMFLPNGREAATIKMVGLCLKDKSYTLAMVASSSNAIAALSGSTATAVPANVITITLSALASSGLPVNADRVYPICFYDNGAIGTTDVTTLYKVCGTYHTLNDPITRNIPRNLGMMLSTKNWTSTAGTANAYTVVVYGSVKGDRNSTSPAPIANVGYYVYPTSTNVAAFRIWGGVGYGTTKMVNQDMTTFHVNTAIGDCWSTTSAPGSVKFDNATGTAGCTYDVTTLSSGLKTTPAANAYYYAHYTRPLKSTDTKCDTEITINTTQLCFVWKDGDATLTDFATKHDGTSCVTFTASYAAALLSFVALALVAF